MSVRLHLPRERLQGDRVELDDDEVGYLCRVRRLSPGAEIEVFDGRGGTVAARLLEGARSLSLGARTDSRSSYRFEFELWQALPKGDRLDWIVQKATELGLSRLVLFSSERAVVRLTPERGAARVARLRKIAQEAARQCGRSDVPEIAEPARFEDFVQAGTSFGVRLLLYERETERGLWSALSQIPSGSRVSLAIGPEGGFSPEEIELATRQQIPRVSLGERVLRVDTAAVAACTLAAMASGRLGTASHEGVGSAP